MRAITFERAIICCCGILVGCRGLLELLQFALYQHNHPEMLSQHGGEMAYTGLWLLSNLLAVLAGATVFGPNRRAAKALVGWGVLQILFATYRIVYAVVSWHGRYPAHSWTSGQMWDAVQQICMREDEFFWFPLVIIGCLYCCLRQPPPAAAFELLAARQEDITEPISHVGPEVSSPETV